MIANQTAKCEKVDNEIEEIAKAIKLANEKKMVQSRNFQITQNNQVVELSSKEVKSEDWTLLCDKTSIQGQFGWTEIGSTIVPYLIRSNEKYVALRMAENKILVKYKNMFTDEVHNCFRVKLLHVTVAEAQLLNEINFRHCDNLYGRLEFSVSDRMISLEDLTEMYEFLNFCYLRLIEKIAVPQNKCGFIKIASQNCVPYVWQENKQYVPLFYFEGECTYLEERSMSLSGWELSYLKLYCKIQGIRKVLFDETSIRVVELELVKKFFPPDTLFEETWPTDYNMDSLVQRPLPKLIFSQPQDKCIRINSNNKVNQHQQNSLKEKGVDAERNIMTQKKPNLIPINADITTDANQSLSGTSQANINRTFIPSELFSTSNVNQNQNIPMLRTSNKLPVPSYILPPFQDTNSVANPNYQRSFVNSLPSPLSTTAGNFTNYCQIPPVRPPGIISTTSRQGLRLLQIPEVFCRNAYYTVKIQVEDKFLQHCINMEAFSTTILLVTLEEISKFFDLPVALVMNAVNVMNLDIFLPNKMQRKELKKLKVYSTTGLLKIRDFVDNLPQLRYILTSKA